MKTNLPQAIAALVDCGIEYATRSIELNASGTSFECHKALRSITGDCVIKDNGEEIEHQYGKLWLGELENPYRGIGSDDEEAIFAAVLDWWEKNV